MVVHVFMTLLVHRAQLGTSQLVLVRIVIQLPGQSSHRQLRPLCNVILPLRSTRPAEGRTKTEDTCMMEPSLYDFTFYCLRNFFTSFTSRRKNPPNSGQSFLIGNCCLFSGQWRNMQNSEDLDRPNPGRALCHDIYQENLSTFLHLH